MSLQGRLSLALAYVGLLAVVSLLVPLALSVRDRVEAEVRSQALSQAQLVAASVPGTRGVDELAASAGRSTRGRVLILGADGRVRADSAGAAVGDDYATRPEIAGALRGRVVQTERASETLDQTLLATAVPVLRAGRPAGAVRVTQSTGSVRRAVRRAVVGLAGIGAIVLGLGVLAGVVLARQIARPLRRLDLAARRVAAGDLAARVPVDGSTEQRSLAATFNDMAARLERLVTSQRRFVADASHQLRTPLTGLRLRLEEAEAVSGPEARAELARGMAEVDRLAAMVDDLLALSEAEEADAPAEAVDLAAAAQRAGDRWAGPAAERGVTLTVEAAGGGRVRAAATHVDRILDVLVENALAYGPEGQEVRVVAGPDCLEVLDEGPGVAGEEEAVFERFHRGRAGRSGPPGSGLGLAMARSLARGWGGDVRLEPRSGSAGTRALLILPTVGA